VSRSSALAWLLLALLLGFGAPGLAQELPFDVADDGAPAVEPDLRLASEADPVTPFGSSTPFRLLPEGVLFAHSDEPTPLLEPPGEDQVRRALGAAPDWAGIGRDTGFFLGYQVISVAVLSALPAEIWDDKTVSFESWWDNVSRPPTWDNDAFVTNYIGHPYWGATYYIRARERGFGRLASFGYSALLSTMYEYGVEAFLERPSNQDLIVTPILGSLLGAFVFEPVRDWVKRKPRFEWYDHALLIVTDPLGLFSSVLERLLGIKSEILLQPTPPSPAALGIPARDRGRTGSPAQGFSVSVNIVWE
jgi:hypothetical protein